MRNHKLEEHRLRMCMATQNIVLQERTVHTIWRPAIYKQTYTARGSLIWSRSVLETSLAKYSCSSPCLNTTFFTEVRPIHRPAINDEDDECRFVSVSSSPLILCNDKLTQKQQVVDSFTLLYNANLKTMIVCHSRPY